LKTVIQHGGGWSGYILEGGERRLKVEIGVKERFDIDRP